MSGIGSMTGEVVSMEASLANAAAPLGLTSPAFAEAPVAKTVETDLMTVTLPSSAFKKLKDESIEKGKKKAFAEFEAKAKAAGFDSFDEMFSAATAQKTAPVSMKTFVKAQTEATVPPPPKKTGDSTVDRERERLYRDKLKLQSKLDREGLRRRELQRELDAREAEMSLRESAAMSGVRDIDYAIRLLERIVDALPRLLHPAGNFRGWRESWPSAGRRLPRSSRSAGADVRAVLRVHALSPCRVHGATDVLSTLQRL